MQIYYALRNSFQALLPTLGEKSEKRNKLLSVPIEYGKVKTVRIHVGAKKTRKRKEEL